MSEEKKYLKLVASARYHKWIRRGEIELIKVWILIKKGILIMSCFDHRGNFLNVYRTGEALDNGLGNNNDLAQHYLDQQEVCARNFLNVYRTGEALDNGLGNNNDLAQHYLDQQEGNFLNIYRTGEALDNGLGNNNDLAQHYLDQQEGNFLNVYRTGEALDNGLGNNNDLAQHYLDQQEGGTSQFATTPNHAEVNPGSMNFQPSQVAQQQGGTSRFTTTPNHAEVNPGSMNFQPFQGAQQQGGTSRFATTPNHAEVNPGSMNFQPFQGAQQQDAPIGGTSQFATTTNHAEVNPGSMNFQPFQGAQQPGTSQSSNVSNADAEKRARIRESKRNSWVKKETERKENEKRLTEVTKENGVLLEANARLEKEGGEAKVKQKSVEQELSYCKEEVSRLNNKLRGQTMQVDVLSAKLVANPEATDVAEENKQLKRKIELLMTATNNPDIIKTVELQEENEKLKRELKKLRFINDALCVTLSKDEQ
ncbi:hypothetical protein OIU79_008924 [Salix purpurea]|uniref:BZIP domain-containing protein n=1 Tax=Salix purpurea TaxID=77065 RepID=A0A9Q0TJN2_SALPP|nr:hypothetical protein OIU79_008924 [Salix purpurea]